MSSTRDGIRANGVMDHGLIPYLPITARPQLRWPGGARVALIIVPNIEHYEFVPPKNAHKNPYPRYPSHPDVVGYSYRDYGNRVGFWRLLTLFDELQIRPTVSLNLAVLDLYPEIRDAMLERSWCLMSHGLYNTRYLFGMSEAEERHYYRETNEIARRHTGRPVKGMLGPSFSSSPNTARLMAEAGFVYQMDWFVDDQPFPITVPNGRLIGIPYSRELNDAFMFPGAPFYAWEAQDFVDACNDQLKVLLEEGSESGRVMTIALHPFAISQPYRHRYLRELLSGVVNQPGVWQATADEVADHFLATAYDATVERIAEHAASYPRPELAP